MRFNCHLGPIFLHVIFISSRYYAVQSSFEANILYDHCFQPMFCGSIVVWRILDVRYYGQRLTILHGTIFVWSDIIGGMISIWSVIMHHIVICSPMFLPWPSFLWPLHSFCECHTFACFSAIGRQTHPL